MREERDHRALAQPVTNGNTEEKLIDTKLHLRLVMVHVQYWLLIFGNWGEVWCFSSEGQILKFGALPLKEQRYNDDDQLLYKSAISRRQFEMMSLMTGLLTVFNVFNLNYVEANNRQGAIVAPLYLFSPGLDGDGWALSVLSIDNNCQSHCATSLLRAIRHRSQPPSDWLPGPWAGLWLVDDSHSADRGDWEQSSSD